MALRKKKIRELQEQKAIRTKRISSHSLTNINKTKRIQLHFRFVRKIKYLISNHIYNNMNDFLFKENKDSLRNQYKLFKNQEMSAWEVQQTYQELFDKYDNSINVFKKQHKFKIQDKIKIERYKKKSKYYQKGDIKSKKIIFKTTKLTQLMNWLVYIQEDELDSVLKSYKENATDEANNKVKAFNDYLNKIRNNKERWERVKALVLIKQKRIISKVRKIIPKTGSYRKAVKENPNVTSVSNEIIIDHSNNHFKHYYKFKISRKEVLYFPLAYNKDFHNNFNKINLKANHYVSLNHKNQINIGLQEEFNQTFQDTICKKQICGIDLNIKHNFCVIDINGESIIWDYDRDFFKKQIESLKAIDAVGYNRLSLTNKRKLNKIILNTESYFQRLISEILDSLQNKEITEIVLEDLNLQKTAFKLFNNEFNVSYSRLVKILRLNQVKHWFKNQANKRGIKVHFTSPCATSQECSQCHHIDKHNRKTQELFECVECGHKENADNQSAFTIGERIRKDVLLEKLHNQDKYGQCTPKIMSRDSIKRTIKSCYKQQSRLNRDPFVDCKGETNSKCEA